MNTFIVSYVHDTRSLGVIPYMVLKKEHALKLEGADVHRTAFSSRNNPEYTSLSIMSVANTTHYQFCIFLYTDAEYIFEHSCSKNINL